MTATLATGYRTFEDFLEDPTLPEWCEWVDGKVVPMHAVIDRHDGIVQWAGELLGTTARELDLGRVLGEPFVMRLPDQRRGRSPDLMFVAAEHMHRIQRKHLEGPADLVIEVLSLESQHRDRVEKLGEYERAGVPEYWLIDDDERQMLFYQLVDDGNYINASPAVGDLYQSLVLPPVRFDPRWLWQHPLPKTIPILREWGVV